MKLRDVEKNEIRRYLTHFKERKERKKNLHIAVVAEVFVLSLEVVDHLNYEGS